MQEDDIKHIFKSIAALSVIGIGFVIGLYVWDSRHGGMVRTAEGTLSSLSPAAGTIAGGEDIGSHFSLLDHDGNPVTQDTYAGSFKLVFFGFSSCPDICPATLQKLSSALNQTGPQADNVRVLFITVDPENDTPEALKTYLSEYGGRFTGLTGTQAQIDEMIASFKVYAEKAETLGGNVSINHSAITYFMGPDNRLLEVFDSSDGPDAIAGAIRNLIPQG